jgi:hypothetical protein
MATDTAGTSKNITVSRKVGKLLDITVNESLKESLTELTASGYPTADNTPKQRKQLRGALESRVMNLHQTFLERFAVVREAYREVKTQIETVSDCCDSLQSALAQGKDARVGILSNVGLLRDELSETQRKEERVREFMEQYQLTPEELQALKGDVSPLFVAALLKTKRIHDSCRGMLSVEHQQAAVEVMETMYLTQVSAAEKLTRHLVPLTSEMLCHDVPQVTQFYVDAVQAIQDKPGQWAKVIHEVSRVRRIAVLRRFYDVVAAAGGEGRQSAHDAPRFVGDVLAWLHQCIAEEADVISVFFSSQSTASGDNHHIMDTHTITKPVVLDQIFEGLCKHLGDKIDLTVEGIANGLNNRNHDSHVVVLVTLFRVEGLLRFYSDIAVKLLGEKASLSTLLQSRRLNCLRLFFEALKSVAGHMLTPRSMTTDFSVPHPVQEVIQTLKAMMDTLQASTIPHSERESDFQPVLGAIIDPLPGTIDAVFSDLRETGVLSHTGPEKNIFRINVYNALRSALAPYSFTTTRQALCDEVVQADIRHYVDFTATKVLRRFGFDEHVATLRGGDPVPVASLQSVLHAFYTYIYNTGTLTLPLLERIQSYQIREGVRGKITTVVCSTYEVLYQGIISQATTDQIDDGIRENTPEKIRLLLEADGSRKD